jgi:ABC-type sulfate transport system permease component
MKTTNRLKIALSALVAGVLVAQLSASPPINIETVRGILSEQNSEIESAFERWHTGKITEAQYRDLISGIFYRAQVQLEDRP